MTAMITTICMNPSFDKTVEMDRLNIGKVNRIRCLRVDPGGKGINVAIDALRLGMDVRCIGIMGEKGSTDLSAMLDQEGLQHRFLSIPGMVRTNMKVLLKEEKDVTEFNEPGTEVSEEDLNRFFEIAREETKDSDFVVLTGSLPPGCPEGTYRKLAEALGDRKIILDTQGPELEICAKKSHPFLIKPNVHEMEATLGLELRTMRSIRDAALLFLRLGVQHTVISMGSMGAMYVDSERTLFAPALRIETKSTVGAGDAMISGMLLGYEREGDMAKAFRYGVAAGAAAVMTESTQLTVPADFERMVDQVRVQEV